MADAFDTIVLARRAERIFRVSAWFYAVTWRVFALVARTIKSAERRERLLSTYGPLSLLGLLALWAASVIAAFARAFVGFSDGICRVACRVFEAT